MRQGHCSANNKEDIALKSKVLLGQEEGDCVALVFAWPDAGDKESCDVHGTGAAVARDAVNQTLLNGPILKQLRQGPVSFARCLGFLLRHRGAVRQCGKVQQRAAEASGAWRRAAILQGAQVPRNCCTGGAREANGPVLWPAELLR